MNHGWDDSTRKDRAVRAERERFGRSSIEPDPDVERRDRMREDERRRLRNQSPWSIGEARYDQRDLYTRNASMDEDGYGVGPSYHPEEGSYAYQRDDRHRSITLRVGDANLYEREAWPWLNYKSPHDDRYFAHLHAHENARSMWQRLKTRIGGALHIGRGPKTMERSDARIEEDVSDALTYRGDLDATDIEVTVRAAEVTLEGTVTDRRSKRIAEEVCEGVRGVRDVHNRLTIRRNDSDDADVAFVLPLARMGT